jgi:AcrR family transcriptional regulator
MELYTERGFEQTTAADIAERAGVTERTFFRHFADKREVLFSGSALLQERILTAIADAPATMGAFETAAAAMEVAADVIGGDRLYPTRRTALINANPSLMERELLKLSNLALAMADALRQRGSDDATAALAAEMAVTIFKVAFERWVGDASSPSLDAAIRSTRAQFAGLATGA